MSTVASPYFSTSSVGKSASSLPAPPTRYDPPSHQQATAYLYYDPYASVPHPTNTSQVAYPMPEPYNVMQLERENERLRKEKYAKLEEENRCLREEIKRTRAENERLAAQNNEFLQQQKQEQEKQQNGNVKATTMTTTSPEATDPGKSSKSGPSRGKQMVGGAAKGAARGVVMGAVAGAVVGKPGKGAEMGAATGAAGGAMNGLLFGGGRRRRY